MTKRKVATALHRLEKNPVPPGGRLISPVPPPLQRSVLAYLSPSDLPITSLQRSVMPYLTPFDLPITSPQRSVPPYLFPSDLPITSPQRSVLPPPGCPEYSRAAYSALRPCSVNLSVGNLLILPAVYRMLTDR